MSDVPLSLYVHMPWCVRKCPYCDFNSHQRGSAAPPPTYIDALIRDFERELPSIGEREIESVFFGGGTPSLFQPEEFARLLEALRRRTRVAADAEVTLEANPGTVERGRFAGYRDAGINRVSLGAQSFAPAALVRLGRIHAAEDTHRAVEELHAAGLVNFNLDLMYALPEQTLEEALADVRIACSLGPAHISHYQLTLEPGTVFAARPPPLPDEDAAAAMLSACGERLSAAGFAHYEVSAYARAGRECRHNLNYWTFGDYLGIGAGAHGKLTSARRGEIVRTTQQREPRRYLAARHEELARRGVSAAELPFEFMLNALRLTGGFTIPGFRERTGLELAAIAAPLAAAEARGLLERTTSGYRPSALGLRFLNDVLLSFLPQNAEIAAASELSTAAAAPAGNSRPLFTGAGGGITE
jgi:putative oxygen-independent coproporphyrinogen III oxidase